MLTAISCTLAPMGAWQGGAMVSLKFQPDPPNPNLLRLTSRPILKLPYSHFRGGQPAGRAAASSSTPLYTPRRMYMGLVETSKLKSPNEHFSDFCALFLFFKMMMIPTRVKDTDVIKFESKF
jgi:hypothetical protein